MSVIDKIKDTLTNKTKWSEVLGKTPNMGDALTSMHILWKYHPDNDGSIPELGKVSLDDHVQMMEDMSHLAALQLWLGILVGRLTSLEKAARKHVKHKIRESYIEHRRAKETQDMSKHLSESAGREDEITTEQAAEALSIVLAVYDANKEMINVLKRAVDSSKTDNTRAAKYSP